MKRAPKPVRDVVGGANTAATIYGGADAFAKVSRASGAGLPGSEPLGPVGAMLAGLGLVDDVSDMAENGITADNSVSALSNGLGLGSWAASLGPAGGLLSSTAAPLMASGAAGLTIGRKAEDYVARSGLLGRKSDDPDEGRAPSDMASDWGMWVRENWGWGPIGGGVATAAGSVVGTGAAVLSVPGVAWDEAGKLSKEMGPSPEQRAMEAIRPEHALLDGVADQVGRARGRR